MILNSTLLQRSFRLLLLLVISVFAGVYVSAQTIGTDKGDYQPGDILVVTGTGWQPGEMVELHIVETPMLCANGHTLYATADENGEIINNEFNFTERHRNLSFALSARGQASGLTAQTTFTDAGPSGAINILSTASVIENFNSLTVSSGPVALPTAWSLQQSAAPTWSGGSNATSQSANSGSPTQGAQYAWGNATNTDKSIGAMTSGSFASPNSLMAKYVNSTPSAITQVAISYNVKKYRTNTAAASVQFFYSTDGTTWTAVTAGDVAAATIGTGANAYLFSSPTVYPVNSFNITGLNILANGNIYLRWNMNTTGSNSQGIGIDDVSVTAAFAPTVNAGIFESYAILNFGGSDIFYDLNAATANTDFNGANLGTFNSGQALYLDGAQNKTFKCSPADITNGKLFYRVYPTGGSVGSFNAAINLDFSSNDPGAGCQNQTWQKADAGVNLLTGLCDGNYTVEVYTAADYQGAGTGTLLANNGGANYKASFTVKNDDRSGIYQSALVLKINGNTTFYDLLGNTPNFDFTGSLGTFCSNESLVIAGAENKTFKCSPNDITSNALLYRIYAGAAPGTFTSISPLNFISDDGASTCGGLNQTWRSTANTTNLLAGLAPGTYTLEVYTQDSYTSNGICAGTNYANNGGANYKATFTVLAPVTFTTKPGSTINLVAGAGCTATGTYSFVTSGSAPVSLNYTFSGATTASGTGTGTGSFFNKGTTAVTVTGSNACSPDASYTFNVVVADATPPSVLTKNITVNLDANGTATITADQVDNGSSDACGIASRTVNPASFNCDNLKPKAADLFFSEYVEGSGNIKALEIYNGTSNTINLASGNYVVRFYSNGSTTIGTTIALTGSINPGDVFVLATSTSGIMGADQYSAVAFYNGNDAVALAKNNVNIDIIGQIGFDPGTEWGTGLVSTENNTLRRKSHISAGDANGADAFVPSTEWDGFAQDDVSGLGSHTFTGTNLVTLTVLDNNGNSATGTAFVTVKDVTSPVQPTIADATGECSATATAPTTTDNCAGTVTGTTSDPLSYTTQGTHVITWKFDDGNGNVTTATQNVVVKDITAPAQPTIATAMGECSATASVPTTTDNCAGTVTGTTSDPLTYTTQGTHVITWKFDDGNGNVTTAAQDVVVKDITAPAQPTIAAATGECSATASVPTTTDNCAGTVTGTTSDPLTYTTQGTHVITWKFDDGNGNVTTAAQNVVVKDITAPAQPTIAAATGECSATASVPTTTDNCAGTVAGTTSDPLTYTTQGTYVIMWKFDDGNGNITTAAQNVVVKDITAPAQPTIAAATGECAATASVPTTTDNCAGTVTGTTSDPLTYTTQGTHVITWKFDDGNGNVTTAAQNVVVKDITAPAQPTIAAATGECAATVSVPTTTDNCAGTVAGTTADPLTYTTQGTHVITWKFDDGNGNVTTAAQNVVVKDITAPVPDVVTVAAAMGECSVTVTTAPQATDNCAGTVTGTTTDPLTYTVQGTYTIHWNYDDGRGNTSHQDQAVIVKDVTAPSVACTGNKTVNVNNAGCSYKLSGTAWDATGSDNCSVASFSYDLTGATTASNLATLNNAVFNPGVTTVTAKSYDAAGNVSSGCTFTVTVNKSLSATFATDNPILYYGYSADQAATITVKPSGGTAPYKVTIKMLDPKTADQPRPVERTGGKLICGYTPEGLSAANETWTNGTGTTSYTGTTCATNSVQATATAGSVAANGSYSVTVTLVSDARFVACITDANGCYYETPDTVKVDAEDVRCPAGKSANTKVTICHRTGSTKNPCTTLCVDASAVQEHLAHGDFVGSCTKDCVAPVVNAAVGTIVQLAPDMPKATALDVKVTNNPSVSTTPFRLKVVSNNEVDAIQMRVIDGTGKPIEFKTGLRSGQTVEIGATYVQGMYFVEVLQDKQRKVVKLLKQ